MSDTYKTALSEWGAHADAAIAAVTLERDLARSGLASVSAERDTALADLATARDTITRLRAELDACGGEPTPPAGFGVNTHTTWRQSQYADDDRTLAAVQQLGATRIRDFLGLVKWDQAALFRRYRDAGIKVHVAVGHYSRSVEADKPKLIEALLAVADCVDSVAGFNEPDSGGVARSVWLPKTVAWHHWLYGAVKSHPDLEHLLVLPGALQGKDDNPADTAAYAAAIDGEYDRWNAHCYPGNTPDVAAWYAKRKESWPGPTWITEFGGNVSNISPETAARNTTELMRLHNGPGEVCFIYELLGGDEFGMFDNNWQPTFTGQAVIEAQR